MLHALNVKINTIVIEFLYCFPILIVLSTRRPLHWYIKTFSFFRFLSFSPFLILFSLSHLHTTKPTLSVHGEKIPLENDRAVREKERERAKDISVFLSLFFFILHVPHSLILYMEWPLLHMHTQLSYEYALLT